MTKLTCKACGKNFNVLTKEGLCAFCFQNEHKFWSPEFSGPVDKKGNSLQGPMKFSKTKVRKKKKKKKRK